MISATRFTFITEKKLTKHLLDVFFVRYAIKIDIRPCPVSIFSDPVLSDNL